MWTSRVCGDRCLASVQSPCEMRWRKRLPRCIRQRAQRRSPIHCALPVGPSPVRCVAGYGSVVEVCRRIGRKPGRNSSGSGEPTVRARQVISTRPVAPRYNRPPFVVARRRGRRELEPARNLLAYLFSPTRASRRCRELPRIVDDLSCRAQSMS